MLERIQRQIFCGVARKNIAAQDAVADWPAHFGINAVTIVDRHAAKEFGTGPHRQIGVTDHPGIRLHQEFGANTTDPQRQARIRGVLHKGTG
ncbi:MAG: hypothetical protein ACD_10C00693G0003 [uncultured bacterium]|nr:MAG: hypothetical protein ACD_10C00693G0003 [uncultured bacterium]